MNRGETPWVELGGDRRRCRCEALGGEVEEELNSIRFRSNPTVYRQSVTPRGGVLGLSRWHFHSTPYPQRFKNPCIEGFSGSLGRDDEGRPWPEGPAQRVSVEDDGPDGERVAPVHRRRVLADEGDGGRVSTCPATSSRLEATCGWSTSTSTGRAARTFSPRTFSVNVPSSDLGVMKTEAFNFLEAMCPSILAQVVEIVDAVDVDSDHRDSSSSHSADLGHFDRQPIAGDASKLGVHTGGWVGGCPPVLVALVHDPEKYPKLPEVSIATCPQADIYPGPTPKIRWLYAFVIPAQEETNYSGGTFEGVDAIDLS
ncbi:hypothetical protein BHM03_00004460 [Ensete ventricosum]|nr:hypothetical protein BHM03_00004460 [Ensete ventricosum]